MKEGVTSDFGARANKQRRDMAPPRSCRLRPPSQVFEVRYGRAAHGAKFHVIKPIPAQSDLLFVHDFLGHIRYFLRRAV